MVQFAPNGMPSFLWYLSQADDILKKMRGTMESVVGKLKFTIAGKNLLIQEMEEVALRYKAEVKDLQRILSLEIEIEKLDKDQLMVVQPALLAKLHEAVRDYVSIM